jgi:type I restriction enzyme R subunit
VKLLLDTHIWLWYLLGDPRLSPNLQTVIADETNEILRSPIGIINTYIGAEASEVISNFNDLTLIDLIVQRGRDAIASLPQSIREHPAAVAETIENNLRKLIVDKQPTNPKYFDRMSVLLDELIEARKQESQAYEDYIEQIVKLSEQVADSKESSRYPPAIDSAAKRALYDNLDRDLELALALDRTIRQTKKDGWRGHKIKEREVKNAIKTHLPSEADANRIFEIVKSQDEY